MNPQLMSYLLQQARGNNPQEISSRVRSTFQPASPSSREFSYVPEPGTKEWSIGYNAGRSVADPIINHQMLRPLGSIVNNLGVSHLDSGLTGAAIGGAIGAGSGLLGGGNVGGRAATGAAMGGSAMLLLSLLARNRMNNTSFYQRPLSTPPGRVKASFYMGGSDSDVQSKVMGDNSLDPVDKTTLLHFVKQLAPDRKAELQHLIGTVSGAGVGLVIARFLLGLGIGGTALLSLVGAGVGRVMSGGSRNAFGRSVDTKRDLFGQARFV